MATEEPVVPTEPTEPAAAAPASEEKPAVTTDEKLKKTKKAPMIKEAIVSLKERTGSSPYAIAKFIEENQKNLPANFKKVLSTQLKKFVTAGKLVKVKASYKLPAERAPAKKKSAAKPKTVKKITPVKKKTVAKPKPAPKAKSAVKPKTSAKPKAVVKPAAKAKSAVAKAKPKAKAATKPAKVARLPLGLLRVKRLRRLQRRWR
ncbi:hypothetical protein L1987_69476 [Smallanthus sonchifolius]|uniref:Uncharacterized protein n=1 Tax=Smallanthus sonchifolius TaxID=185202 RepID=A0ACB9B709_9ASTR|nr:hypothetical protein L1987_69476 [Smallanthus sonchifolius]